MNRSATDDLPPASFGGWNDAEELRKWSFLRRTPQQRLDWLADALTICLLARSAAAASYAGDDSAGSRNDGIGTTDDSAEPRDDREGPRGGRTGLAVGERT